MEFCQQRSTRLQVPLTVTIPYNNDVRSDTEYSEVDFNCTCTIGLLDKSLRSGIEIRVGPTRLVSNCFIMSTNEAVSDCLDRVLVTYYQSSNAIGPDTLSVNAVSSYDELKSYIDTIEVKLVNSHMHGTYDSGRETSADNSIMVVIEKRDGVGAQYGK